MPKSIVNRVTKSSLVTIDLEEYYPAGKRICIDIKDWLCEGVVLKEKEFREQLKKFDWTPFKDHYVALHCSTNAILPSWAFMLVATHLNGIAKKTIVGDFNLLETLIFQDLITQLDLEHLRDKAVVVKGCTKLQIPENAYQFLIEKITPMARSLMFGEACSAVPLHKKSKGA